MKNQNPQDILNEILLRMRYDSSKTLSENKEIILEQGSADININRKNQEQLSQSSETIKQQLRPGEVDVSNEYMKVPGHIAISSPGNTYIWIPKESKYTLFSGSKDDFKYMDWSQVKKIPTYKQLITLLKPGTLKSFTTPSGEKYFYVPKINPEFGDLKLYGYLNVDGQRYVLPKPPSGNNLKIKKTSDSLIAAADDDVMSSPEKFAEFLYKLRDIVSSVVFQIFSAALSIAIATVAGPVAALFSKLLDWGIDVIVLIADLIAALMYPENTLHFEHLGQDVINIGLSFGIMGLFKLGAKTLKEAVNLLTPELKLAIKQFREWITSSLNKIISMVEGTSISGFLKTFKEWVENLFDKNFGKIFSSFVLIGLPVSTMIYLSMLLAEPLFKKIEGPLSTIVGIPLVWLKDWRLGDEIPAEYAQKLEKINPKMQEGQSEELEKIEQSSEKPTEQDLLDKNSEKMQSISKTIQESNKKLTENNNQEYCNRLISHLSEPCKGYLEKKLTENKVNFAIEGENSGLLMVDNIGYIIEWIPSPPRLLDTSEKELTCIDDNTLPSPVSKG